MYIGNAPGENFISISKQVFTIVNSQTAYSLDFPVESGNDIRLVINNVVQQAGSGKAYTASGQTLTLSEALTNGTDEMYCVFLGKARETVTVPTITKDKVDFISDGTGSGIISKGDGGSVDGSISLNCSQNSHHTRISSSSHSSYAGNLNFVLPNSHGSNGQFLKTDGSGNLSFANAGISMADEWRLTTDLSISNNAVYITANWEQNDTAFSNIGTSMSESSGVFTFPTTGIYLVHYTVSTNTNSNGADNECWIAHTTNNSSYNILAISGFNHDGESTDRANATTRAIFDVTDTSTHKLQFAVRSSVGMTFKGSSSYNRTFATFIRLGDT